VSNEPQIQELVALYAMISRMRVLSRRNTSKVEIWITANVRPGRWVPSALTTF
jgi:hypothetical protein